jgi:hypothetical protein
MDTLRTVAQIWENIWHAFSLIIITLLLPSLSFSKMVELNNTFRLVRTLVFGTLCGWLLIEGAQSFFSVATTSLFALIVIILAALVTSYTGNFGGFYNFAALGIATGVLTLVTLPAMFVPFFFFSLQVFLTLHESRLCISRVRKGAFTSMIALEIGWTCRCPLVIHIDIQ